MYFFKTFFIESIIKQSRIIVNNSKAVFIIKNIVAINHDPCIL